MPKSKPTIRIYTLLRFDVTPESFSRFNENLETPRLRNEESADLEGLLTYEECKETLKTFQHGKSPGEDGFTAKFYLEFFDLLGEDLMESFNAAFRTGKLSISQRRGIINLIPKEDAALLELQNWRPINSLKCGLQNCV